MGDKIEAKRTAKKLGIPVVSGSEGGVGSDQESGRIAGEIGFPVLIKAAAGGGGRGMKIARSADELPAALSTARAEAKAAFGDDAIYIEKYLERPRHIEIQVLGDGHGNAIHLGERDCSLQRRHQKVWEEGPSPALNAGARDAIGEMVAKAMREIEYLGVGTVEFLYEDGRFYFIEMNTRIQVEHGLTEMVTGIDLVKWQMRVAAGEKLPFRQADIKLSGHAIECRINCEDWRRDFRPTPGTVTRIALPVGPGLRVDTHVQAGDEIPPYYDSLVAKLIAAGTDRAEALDRLRSALRRFTVEGIATTVPMHLALTREPQFVAGGVDTTWFGHFLQRQKATA